MKENSTFLKPLKNNLRCYIFAVSAIIGSLSSNAQTIYGTIGSSVLVNFNASTPGSITSSVTIVGITPGQDIMGLDFRPNTGQLYAFGYNSSLTSYQVYTINLGSGAATSLNIPTTIALGAGPVGFDFNPTVDRLRVVSANGGNYRLHPVTGLIAATDATLSYAVGDPNASSTPKIVSGAYINSYIGAPTTALYDYDNNLNIIVLQNPPNNGSLTTIGSSGIVTSTSTTNVDMDIFFDNLTATNKAYMVATTSASATADNLYTLNLSTGTASLVAPIGAVNPVSNIAVFIDRTMPAMIGELAYGLSGTNLISFDTQNPNFIRNINTITGITVGQTVVGMDFRPATHTLYALGYNSSNNDAQLYTLNVNTGLASVVNATPTTLMLGTVSIGFDFNPTVDRIRVISNNDMNYRLEPVTGTLAATDANLNYASSDVNFGANPNVGTCAYNNSYSTATTTTLYNYDEVLNILTTQIPPNNGTLNTIGSSGFIVNPSDPTVDMDIYYNGTNNLAYIAANTGTETIDRLYTINLTTGSTSAIGKIGYGIPVYDIAIQTVSISPTGIAGHGAEILNFASVYPNPLQNEAFITFKNNDEYQILVSDISGRNINTVYSTDSTSETTIIRWNTTDLPRGVYFVSVTISGQKQTIKVVK